MTVYAIGWITGLATGVLAAVEWRRWVHRAGRRLRGRRQLELRLPRRTR